MCFLFFKHKTAYEWRISDWSSDVCSSDLIQPPLAAAADEAQKLDRDQQYQHADIGEIGEILENANREAPDDQRHSQENEEAHRLFPRPRRPIAHRRRIEEEQAEGGDPGEEDRKRPRMNTSNKCAQRMPPSARTKKQYTTTTK